MTAPGNASGRRAFLAGMGGAMGVAALPASAYAAPAESRIDLNTLYQAARNEGEVTFYCSNNPPLTARVIKAFNAAYPGIQVNPFRLGTGPLGQRYRSEAQAGNVVADVLELADPMLIDEAYHAGWLSNITALPAWKDIPAYYKGEAYGLVGVNPHVITYNTDTVTGSDRPTQWRDILNPKWKGQIFALDLRNGPLAVDWAWFMVKSFGMDFLRQFAEQQPKWVESTVPGTQQLAAGEAAMLVPNQRQVTFSLIANGAPLADAQPAPYSGHESLLGVSTKAPHPNAARLLADFVLSRAGAKAENEGVSSSVLPNVTGTLPLPADYHRAAPAEAMKHYSEILAVFHLS